MSEKQEVTGVAPSSRGRSAALRAEPVPVSGLRPAPANAWQPIATAPKDGTDVLLGSGPQEFRGQPVPARVTIGHWTTEEECRVYLGDCGGECRCPEYEEGEPSWISWDGGFTKENPVTHWMPLPDPPESAS